MIRKKQGRLKKVYYSSITSLAYQFVSLICGFIIPMLILNAYGSMYNGLVAAITQFLVFFSILQAGVQGATRVTLYKYLAYNNLDKISSVMLANERYYRKLSFVLIGYIFLLAMLFPLLFMNELSSVDVILLVLIIGSSNFVQFFCGNAYRALISADQSFYVINILQTITILLNTAICAFIILNGGSIVLTKFGSAIVYGLNPIILFIYVRKHYKLRKDVPEDQSALKNRWDVLANSIANIVHENVDVLLITILCKVSEISVYAVYNLVSSGLIRLIQVFTGGTEAAFGDMWTKKEYSLLRDNFRKYEIVMLSLAVFLSGCMLILLLPFVAIYTSNVHDAEYYRPYLAILFTLSIFTRCIRQPYITMVQAAGHYKQTKFGSIMEAIINLVLTLVMIPLIGIEGAVLGTVIANSFRTIQYGRYVYNNIINKNMVEMLKKVIWAIITIVVAFFSSKYLVIYAHPKEWLEWLINSIITSSVHFLVIFFMSVLFYKNDVYDVWSHVKKLKQKY